MKAYFIIAVLLGLALPLVATNLQVTVTPTKLIVDTPQAVDFTVVVKNLEPLPEKVTVSASVTYTYNGLVFTAVSAPISVQIYHPVTLENLRLSLPEPYAQKAPIPAFTLYEQQVKVFTIQAVLPQ